ncbi:carboxylesterase/lipase family protein [Rhizobiales bacterium TNE-4]|nr:carboxylesterase/lipase family protein [Rhizobiales bacterium TNE-4]MBV1827043.1 carboxylesterase family protein [Rhizobiales bacterium TNE-4]
MSKISKLIIATGLSLAALSAHATDVYHQPRPILETKNGKLQGVETQGMVVYRNIPYAAPPVGDLRWRPPQPAQSWSGVRDASRFGEACVQFLVDGLNNELVPGSEDCLKLNVYAPKNAKNRPVMVWIHGGGLVEGSGSERYYIPTGLVAEDVVVVTIDYRIGRFGFFAPTELVEEAKKNNEPVGNYGVMDQIQALKWVRDNIATFGGDPNNVTIFGQSAGGRSVTWLMTSPASKGLFHKAIAQSPQQLPMRDVSKPRHGKPSVEESDTKFMASLGAKSLKDLRAMPTDQVALTTKQYFTGEFDGEMVDGQIIIGDSIPMFAEGKQHKVPFMVGTLSWDASFFIMGAPPVDAYIKKMGQDPKIVAKLYANYKWRCQLALSSQMMADGWYTGAVKLLADSANKYAPSYAYYYSFMTPTLKASFIGPAHTFELPYVFGDLATVPRAPAKAGKPADPCTEIDQAFKEVKANKWASIWFPVTAPNNREDISMKEQLTKSWTAFAKTGNPNYGKREIWPRYDLATDTMREFANGKQGVVKNLNKDRVDYQLQFIKALYQVK